MSVNAVVEDVVEFLRREFQAHDTLLELSLAEALPEVFADKTQLQQVLVNLAMNALQAMAEQPSQERRLRIETRRGGDDRVRIVVADDGPGIPPEQLPRLFDSFYTTKSTGLGIGLSIGRSMIEAHGGSITASNAKRGARFEITLPAAARLQDAAEGRLYKGLTASQ